MAPLTRLPQVAVAGIICLDLRVAASAEPICRDGPACRRDGIPQSPIPQTVAAVQWATEPFDNGRGGALRNLARRGSKSPRFRSDCCYPPRSPCRAVAGRPAHPPDGGRCDTSRCGGSSSTPGDPAGVTASSAVILNAGPNQTASAASLLKSSRRRVHQFIHLHWADHGAEGGNAAIGSNDVCFVWWSESGCTAVRDP